MPTESGSAPLPMHTRVNVGPAYVGNGAYKHEAICDRSWFVVGHMPGSGGMDYKLAGFPGEERDWAYIVHESRIVPMAVR